MPRFKRKVTTFSLSFLDIMACGFGAVTLLFLILKHDITTIEPAEPYLVAESNLLQEDITSAEEELVALNNSLKKIEASYAEAQGLSRRILAETEDIRRELSIQVDPKQEVDILRQQIEALKQETSKLEAQENNKSVRHFSGDGQRQYVTGLNLGGRRIVILLDASASMLSDTIVNVLRRRNMSDEVKRKSDKWQRAVRTVEWLVAQLPPDSQYQIYTFNTEAKAINGDDGVWRNTSDGAGLNNTIKLLKQITPKGGTSLINAFSTLQSFNQRPDNLLLITDGLPTQGRTPPKGSTISGRERLKLFEQAVVALPRQIPVNILLFPMEGDPLAATSFWQLAISSNGSFISPSKDWP